MENKGQTLISIYDSGLKELGFKLLNWYKIGILTELSKSQVEILNSLYYVMAKEKLTEIEKLPEKQKKEIWEFVKPHTKHVSKKDKIKIAKAYYTLNAIAETSNQNPDNIQPVGTGKG